MKKFKKNHGINDEIEKKLKYDKRAKNLDWESKH
jgi:hypothetical protein